MTTIQFALTTQPARASSPLARIWQSLKAVRRPDRYGHASRPSDQALTILSQRDRLTERH